MKNKSKYLDEFYEPLELIKEIYMGFQYLVLVISTNFNELTHKLIIEFSSLPNLNLFVKILNKLFY